MTNISDTKEKTMEEVIRVANSKRLSLLPTSNNLDHVSWAAMIALLMKYRDSKTSDAENAHITRMASHLGMDTEQFVTDMEARIETGLIMSTGTLIGVTVAAGMIYGSENNEGVQYAFDYFNQYMNFF